MIRAALYGFGSGFAIGISRPRSADARPAQADSNILGQETCEEGSFRVQSWNRLLAAKTQPLDYTPTTFAILARGIPQVG